MRCNKVKIILVIIRALLLNAVPTVWKGTGRKNKVRYVSSTMKVDVAFDDPKWTTIEDDSQELQVGLYPKDL